MSDDIGRVAAADRPADWTGAAVGKAHRRRRPTGEPPPLPHPVTITTTAWLAIAAAALAGAFVVAQRTSWLGADDWASTWVLRQLAVIRTPWLTDMANAINVAGSGWGAVYCLAVPGRARSRAKAAVAAVVAVFVLARLYLGVEHPDDALLGAAFAAALAVTAFRYFTPNEVFPVAYRRGRTAHVDVTGQRGVAIRRAMRDQLGLHITEIKPVGLASSAGSTPLRLRVEGSPEQFVFAKLYTKGSLRHLRRPADPLRPARNPPVRTPAQPPPPVHRPALLHLHRRLRHLPVQLRARRLLPAGDPGRQRGRPHAPGHVGGLRRAHGGPSAVRAGCAMPRMSCPCGPLAGSPAGSPRMNTTSKYNSEVRPERDSNARPTA